MDQSILKKNTKFLKERSSEHGPLLKGTIKKFEYTIKISVHIVSRFNELILFDVEKIFYSLQYLSTQSAVPDSLI
jgi:hypothetical protein